MPLIASAEPALPVVSFNLSGGDPGALQDLSARLDDGAYEFEGHEQTIRGAASCVQPVWQGQAADAYAELSAVVAAYFGEAGTALRAASRSVRTYALELERCQREGRIALQEAQHWIGQVALCQARLRQAVRAVSTAQRDVDCASRSLEAAQLAGPLGAGQIAAATGEIAAAGAALVAAQACEAAARRSLQQAHDELDMWQAGGRRAWKEAQTAAEHLTGRLAPLHIAPPPLAGPLVMPVVVAPSVGRTPTGQECQSGQIAESRSPDQSGSGRGLPTTTALSALFAGILRMIARELEAAGGDAVESSGEEQTAGAVRQTVTSLSKGRSPRVHAAQSDEELDALYDRLAAGGSPKTSNYAGKSVELSDGTIIGNRAVSKSGGPIIDVRLPDRTQLKVHVNK